MSTNKIPTMLRLPENLHLKIKQLAATEHRSMNLEIEHALSAYISAYESENGAIPIPSPSEES